MKLKRDFSAHDGAAKEALLEILERGEPARVSVTAKCMRPFFRTGDGVIVAPVGEGELGLGDPVLLLREGSFVLHRYMGRRDGRVLTKADRSFSFDPPAEERELVGRALAVERGGRRRSLLSRRRRLATRFLGAASYACGALLGTDLAGKAEEAAGSPAAAAVAGRGDFGVIMQGSESRLPSWVSVEG